MKKIILLFAFSLILLNGYSQLTFMSGVGSTYSANYPVKVPDNNIATTLSITTNSTFTGTTASAQLQGSSNGLAWIDYQTGLTCPANSFLNVLVGQSATTVIIQSITSGGTSTALAYDGTAVLNVTLTYWS